MQIFLWILLGIFGIGFMIGWIALLGNCIDTDSPHSDSDKPISILDGLSIGIFMIIIPFVVVKWTIDGLDAMTFSIPWWVVIAVSILCLLIGIFGTIKVVRNYYLFQRTHLDEASNQIELLYELRFEEVSGLLKLVRVHASEEVNMVEKIIESQEKIQLAKDADTRVEAMNEQEIRFRNLLTTCSQYPDLKSNQLYLKLMNSISQIEAKLIKGKQQYNERVTDYNHEVQAFPNNMFAKVFEYKKAELFKADPKKVVQDLSDILDGD